MEKKSAHLHLQRVIAAERENERVRECESGSWGICACKNERATEVKRTGCTDNDADTETQK